MDRARINHYKLHLKIYGQLLIELADHDEEVIKIMNGKTSGGLVSAVREQIEAAALKSA